MFAFAPIAPVTAAKATIGNTSFATPLSTSPVASKSTGPTMILRTILRKPTGSATATVFGGAGLILRKADEYMANSVRRQYIAMTNPLGTFGVQCTEGSVQDAAEVSRVRALNLSFRMRQSSPSKTAFDLFENRKNAIASSHECSHEEKQFATCPKVAASYNLGKAEANGTCLRYASPETVEEAAMMRYMDIQQKIAVNPTGVYNVWCNEGAAKGQSEDIRIAALNAAYRQGQKSANKLMDEKYQQKKAGYAASHGCNYEEGLVSNFPAIGASFRSKSYGY